MGKKKAFYGMSGMIKINVNKRPKTIDIIGVSSSLYVCFYPEEMARIIDWLKKDFGFESSDTFQAKEKVLKFLESRHPTPENVRRRVNLLQKPSK
jgi:hypothetical protein